MTNPGIREYGTAASGQRVRGTRAGESWLRASGQGQGTSVQPGVGLRTRGQHLRAAQIPCVHACLLANLTSHRGERIVAEGRGEADRRENLPRVRDDCWGWEDVPRSVIFVRSLDRTEGIPRLRT